MKKAILFPLAVGVTSVALVVVLVLGALFLSPARTVLASALSGSAPWAGGGQHGGWGGGSGFTLPPELQGLMTIPADQRFAHFEGVQVSLKDKNNQPLTINVTPGKVTSASATSLVIAANNGSSQTYTLNAQTMIHTMSPTQSSTPAPTGTPNTAATLQAGDDVVVVTLNNSSTATAVIAGGPNGFAMPGHGGWGPHSSQ